MSVATEVARLAELDELIASQNVDNTYVSLTEVLNTTNALYETDFGFSPYVFALKSDMQYQLEKNEARSRFGARIEEPQSKRRRMPVSLDTGCCDNSAVERAYKAAARGLFRAHNFAVFGLPGRPQSDGTWLHHEDDTNASAGFFMIETGLGKYWSQDAYARYYSATTAIIRLLRASDPYHVIALAYTLDLIVIDDTPVRGCASERWVSGADLAAYNVGADLIANGFIGCNRSQVDQMAKELERSFTERKATSTLVPQSNLDDMVTIDF